MIYVHGPENMIDKNIFYTLYNNQKSYLNFFFVLFYQYYILNWNINDFLLFANIL